MLWLLCTLAIGLGVQSELQLAVLETILRGFYLFPCMGIPSIEAEEAGASSLSE